MKQSVCRMLLGVFCVTLVMLTAFSASAQEKTLFKVWFYERDNAMSASWHYALEKFKENHPDVEVVFELKTFEDTQTTALMVLNSAEAPDVMQINKGNATAGLYANEGLLTNLETVAQERGWDKIMSPRFRRRVVIMNKVSWGAAIYGVLHLR